MKKPRFNIGLLRAPADLDPLPRRPEQSPGENRQKALSDKLNFTPLDEKGLPETTRLLSEGKYADVVMRIEGTAAESNSAEANNLGCAYALLAVADDDPVGWARAIATLEGASGESTTKPKEAGYQEKTDDQKRAEGNLKKVRAASGLRR